MSESIRPAYPGIGSQFIKIFLILLVCGAISFLLVHFKKAPKKHETPALPTLVNTTTAQTSSGPMTIETMGTIEPEKSYDIVAEVAGRVEWISPELIPGGHFKKGQKMLQIEKTDYEIAVQQAIAKVADAKKSLLELQGEARYQKLIDKDRTTKTTPEARSLRLREPQIEAAKATLKAATKTLEQAQRDLQRTAVIAPFDLIITQKNIEIGKYIGRLTNIGTAIGTERFWAVVSLPVSKAKFLSIPGINVKSGQGSKAQIITRGAGGNTSVKNGRVLRLLSELEGQGRMARILVGVDDPMGLESGDTRLPLLINAYVKVTLEGNKGLNTVKLPRKYIRNNNTVWVLNSESQLEIRPVTIAWTTREDAFISKGLKTNENVITTSDLVPVDGMGLTAVGDRSLLQSQKKPEPAPQAPATAE